MADRHLHVVPPYVEPTDRAEERAKLAAATATKLRALADVIASDDVEGAAYGAVVVVLGDEHPSVVTIAHGATSEAIAVGRDALGDASVALALGHDVNTDVRDAYLKRQAHLAAAAEYAARHEREHPAVCGCGRRFKSDTGLKIHRRTCAR